MSPKQCIASWSRKDPSRRDILLMLYLSLDLLSECIPVAIPSVASLQPQEQFGFWEAFVAFEKTTDLHGHGGYQEFDFSEIKGKLTDWASVCHSRAIGCKGDLEAEPNTRNTIEVPR